MPGDGGCLRDVGRVAMAGMDVHMRAVRVQVGMHVQSAARQVPQDLGPQCDQHDTHREFEVGCDALVGGQEARLERQDDYAHCN